MLSRVFKEVWPSGVWVTGSVKFGVEGRRPGPQQDPDQTVMNLGFCFDSLHEDWSEVLARRTGTILVQTYG